MSAGVLGVHPTVHAASQATKAALGISTTALYHKLDRVETRVAAAVVRDSATLAEPVGQALRASHPRGLPGYQIKVLEGNPWSATEQRLKALRGTWAAPFPGPALVVWDQQRRLIPDVVLSEDGHAQERRLLAQVLQHVEEDQRWIEERTFCTLGLRFGRARRGAACVVRQHGPWQGELLCRPTRQGPTRSGQVYEHAILLRDPESGETRRVRRITRKLTEPTRDGDTARHLLSKVPVHRASAPHLTRLYGKRWSMATAFFESTTTLTCESNTWGYPKAAFLAFGLALMAYKAVSLIKAALRRVQGRQKGNDEISSYALALDMGRTYDGRMSAIPAPHWVLFQALSDKECANVLREVASSVHLARDQKHPRGPKKKPPERTAYQNGKHVSTAKLLAQR